MLRHAMRRRPQLESLETMVLPSGIAAAALVATPSSPIALSGVSTGKYHVKAGVSDFTASGKLSPLGHSTLKGSIGAAASGHGYAGSLTIKAAKGKLSVAVTYLRLAGSLSEAEYSYQITGATGHLKGATGDGDAIVTVTPGKSLTQGKLTIDWGVA